MKQLRVGIIGYSFMGKAHSFAYRTAPMMFPLKLVPVMEVICGRNERNLRRAQEQFGWRSRERDWRKVVRSGNVELVDISTPPNIHRRIAEEAAREGKSVFCEKPLSSTLADAYAMLESVEKHGVRHAVCFNYRKLPAMCLVRSLIQGGRLGKIYHMRAVYLQDWLSDPQLPLIWRLDRKVAGSGAHGDINAHIIDLARWLVGEFAEVTGMQETIIRERPLLEQSVGFESKKVKGTVRTGRVTVDDATSFLARFENGALGTFEATRLAAGRKNHLRFEINGSRGSVGFNLERLNEVEFFSFDDPDPQQGFRVIQATEPCHGYAANWWPPGHIIGYGESHTNMVADIMTSLAEGANPSPDFRDGVRCQEVLDAVEQSIRKGEWMRVRTRV